MNLNKFRVLRTKTELVRAREPLKCPGVLNKRYLKQIKYSMFNIYLARWPTDCRKRDWAGKSRGWICLKQTQLRYNHTVYTQPEETTTTSTIS